MVEEEEYIDIKNNKRNLELTLARLRADGRISETNKEIIQQFLRDAALGKTVIGRRKKKISDATLITYILHLYPVMLFLRKDLDKIGQDELERFVEALEGGAVRSRSPRLSGSRVASSGAPLSERYQVNVKKTIKKFYKWLLGSPKEYPPLVSWIDTYVQDKEVAALSEQEIGRMLDRAKTVLQRALIQVLFDGGFRIGELLNIRLKHVRLARFDPREPEKKCFVVRVPFSKTMPRTVALPMPASTKWLTLWLEDHPARAEIADDGSVQARNIDAQLFPTTANAVRLVVGRLGRSVLNQRVYPHLIRHSSATFWANRLPYFKICKRFGWTMTSQMPQRYIDRAGIDELSVARIYSEGQPQTLPGAGSESRGDADLYQRGAAAGRCGDRRIAADVA
ncbi:MAG: site-specific integrase [Phycisphaerales bacterium]|nr:site-specific integrase [Phycisphaerales bacterium]